MKKNQATAVFCFWILLLAMAPLAAGTLTYREVEGAMVTTHVLSMRPGEPGYTVELETKRQGGSVRQTFKTAADYSTLEWTFSDPVRGMELAASVRGKDIVLTGSFQGQKIDKRFAAAGPPWNQLFQMGLGPFVLSGKKSMSFRSIGTQGPGELKIGKMTVTRKEDASITIGGREAAAVQVRISLSGILSMFWHGDYWYRRSDGRFLRYRGKNRSGGPVAVSELVTEVADDLR